MNKRNIIVYKLIDSDFYWDNREEIRRIAFIGLGKKFDPLLHDFVISRNSGWISYRDNPNLFCENFTKRKELSKRELLSIVDAFIKKASRAFSDTKKIQIPFFFPNTMKPFEFIPIYTEPDTVSLWIIKFSILLRSSNEFGSNNLVVKNGLFDITINNKKEIVSFNLQWRPIEARIKATVSDFEEVESEHHSQDSENHLNPPIFFYLCGENTIQTHLAPYYFIQNGHHSSIKSASNMSIEIVFVKIAYGEDLIVRSSIVGGSGKFRFHWAYWDISRIIGFRDLGTENFCTIETGAFHLILTVEDLDFGIVNQHQEFIYNNLIQKDGFA